MIPEGRRFYPDLVSFLDNQHSIGSLTQQSHRHNLAAYPTPYTIRMYICHQRIQSAQTCHFPKLGCIYLYIYIYVYIYINCRLKYCRFLCNSTSLSMQLRNVSTKNSLQLKKTHRRSKELTKCEIWNMHTYIDIRLGNTGLMNVTQAWWMSHSDKFVLLKLGNSHDPQGGLHCSEGTWKRNLLQHFWCASTTLKHVCCHTWDILLTSTYCTLIYIHPRKSHDFRITCEWSYCEIRKSPTKTNLAACFQKNKNYCF